MASQRFWSRVLGPRYTPSKRGRPLFMERRLDNLFGADKYGKFNFLDAVVRALDIDVVDGLVKRREPLRRNDADIALIAGGAGNIAYPIQPEGTEVWEVESIAVTHNAPGDESFELHYEDTTPPAVRIHQLADAGGSVITPAIATQIFPTTHDIQGVVRRGHMLAYGPLEVSNLVYVVVTNATPLPVGTGVGITFMYRRVKL